MITTTKTDKRPRRRLRRVLTAGIAGVLLTGLSLTAVYSVGVSGKPEPSAKPPRAADSILRYVQAAQQTEAGDLPPVAIDWQPDADFALLPPADAQALAQDALKAGDAFLRRAMHVEIQADGAEKQILFVSGTVADALAKAGILLGADDLVFPAADTQLLQRGSEIIVRRVRTEIRTEEQPLPFGTKIVENGDLPAGESRKASAGKAGVKELRYRETYVDGLLTASVFAGESVKTPAEDAVLEIGTGRTGKLDSYLNTDAVISELSLPEGITLDANGVPTNYQYIIEGDATAYTGDPATSTGRTPMPGHIAVDPREIPYGTEMYIVSADGSYVYGYAIAADTGGFIYTTDRLVDLYMDNEQMCDDWGVRGVRIYVL